MATPTLRLAAPGLPVAPGGEEVDEGLVAADLRLVQGGVATGLAALWVGASLEEDPDVVDGVLAGCS